MDETAWVAPDDVLPAVVALGRAGVNRLRRKGRPGVTPAPPRFLSSWAARAASR